MDVANEARLEFEKAWLGPAFWLVWMGFGLVWVLSLCPVSWRHVLAGGLARAAYRWNPKRRRIVLANLKMAFPEWDDVARDALARKHFSAMSRSFLDMGVFWFSSDKRLLKFVRVEGADIVRQVRERGRQVIFHVAHSAGLEFGAIGAATIEPVAGLYQPLKNPLLNWRVARSRQRTGNAPLPRNSGFRGMVKAARSGKALFCLTDEDLGLEQGAVAPFFGHDKATLITTARIAAATDASVIPLMVYFSDQEQRYVVMLGEPIEGLKGERGSAERDARLLNESLEQLIRPRVHEYMWVLKLYRSTAPEGVYRWNG